MNNLRLAIVNEIDVEREKQEAMWGDEGDDANSEETWNAIVTREMGEGLFHDDDSATFRKQLIKSGAVIFAAIESLDRTRRQG